MNLSIVKEAVTKNGIHIIKALVNQNMIQTMSHHQKRNQPKSLGIKRRVKKRKSTT